MRRQRQGGKCLNKIIHKHATHARTRKYTYAHTHTLTDTRNAKRTQQQQKQNACSVRLCSTTTSDRNLLLLSNVRRHGGGGGGGGVGGVGLVVVVVGSMWRTRLSRFYDRVMCTSAAQVFVCRCLLSLDVRVCYFPQRNELCFWLCVASGWWFGGCVAEWRWWRCWSS